MELHKITSLTMQTHNTNRVNVFVDGSFRLSLGLAQVVDEGLKVGLELDEARLMELQQKSVFGKYYQRALEYALARPHSEREVRDYLRRKTLPIAKRVRDQNGNYKTIEKSGMDAELIQPIIEKLQKGKYLDDARFAEFWVENRNLKKGVSARKLRQELLKKGVANEIIEKVLAVSERTDADEIQKIIAKKRAKYDDKKLVAHLVQRGFDYATALRSVTDSAAPDDWSVPETDSQN
ncbi:MAG: RecX family transcriptional regulator [Candidatus Nomurabacteria bacterium]|jgi:regulatory protein|nr:RecX family transcriptional regulator [Candidatus Nomurabacteria bacterium]